MRQAQQLTFEEIFAAEEQKRATKHLPGDIELAIPFYRGLIEQFHAALCRGEVETAEKISQEAHQLAYKLNGGEPGIKADQNAPAYFLSHGTHAEVGTVPLWGQTGEFIIVIGTMRVRIEMDGIFGTGAMPIPGFAAHIVDPDKPFLSGTGYRSFVSAHAAPALCLTPDAAVHLVISSHIKNDLKGRLRPLETRYRDRFASAAPTEEPDEPAKNSLAGKPSQLRLS